MALDITPEIESAIRTGHATGKSQTAIGKEIGLPQQIVCRMAKKLGIVWTENPAGTAQAHEKIRKQLSERRMKLAEQALADAINIRERIWEPYVVPLSTPAGVVEHQLDIPDAKATSDFVKAVERLVMTHDNLTRMGAGSSADFAKSMLVQMQEALLRAATSPEDDDE
jgi:hypothetical protein